MDDAVGALPSVRSGALPNCGETSKTLDGLAAQSHCLQRRILGWEQREQDAKQLEAIARTCSEPHGEPRGTLIVVTPEGEWLDRVWLPGGPNESVHLGTVRADEGVAIDGLKLGWGVWSEGARAIEVARRRTLTGGWVIELSVVDYGL